MDVSLPSQMAFTKICPQCGSEQHCRRSVCEKCGFVWHSKACKKVNKSEQEIELHREGNRVYHTRKRARESELETVERQASDRQCKAKKRKSMTEQEHVEHKANERQYRARKSARESELETIQRRASKRQYKAKKRESMTEPEHVERKTNERQYQARKRARESEHETVRRRASERQCKAEKRESMTEQEHVEHKANERQYQARKRARESEHETVQRRASERQCKAKKRESMTEQEHVEHKANERQYQARKRARESEHETVRRKTKNKCSMANARSKVRPVVTVIEEFQAKVKVGPEYVCTSCHRMMYKHSVVIFKPTKYTQASPELLGKIDKHCYVIYDDNQWICKTCDSSLSRNVLPLQAKANCLVLDTVPPELELNPLELRLISLRIPLMKMLALPSGKQRAIKGPAVNVPSKIDRVCKLLPRLPSQCELVPLKLKRKLSYRGHYLYDYVSPEKLTSALRWLKANNPLYAIVKITDDWLDKALEDDEELVISMLQLPIDESIRVDAGDQLSEHEQPGDSADSASNLSEHECANSANDKNKHEQAMDNSISDSHNEHGEHEQLMDNKQLPSLSIISIRDKSSVSVYCNMLPSNMATWCMMCLVMVIVCSVQ